jgi:hypothetical protein
LRFARPPAAGHRDFRLRINRRAAVEKRCGRKIASRSGRACEDAQRGNAHEAAWFDLRFPVVSAQAFWSQGSAVSRFTFNDIVQVRTDAPSDVRPGQKASVFMVWLPQDRTAPYYDRFPSGVVYSIEFEGGHAVDVHEDWLEDDRLERY